MSTRKPLITLILLISTLTATAFVGNGLLYTSNRLSSSSVNCARQDAYGYIWICTDYGLNRFDGYRFTSYFHNTADTTSLITNETTATFCDSRQRLWIGCDKGLMQYDYGKNCFLRYHFPLKRTPRVKSITELKDGTIVIATSGYGLYCIRSGTDRIVSDNRLNQIKGNDFIYNVYEDKLGGIWQCGHLPVITRTLLKGNAPKTTRYNLKHGPAVCFLPAGSRDVLIVCMYGILRYDARRNVIKNAAYDLSVLDSKTSIRCAVLDSKGDLIIGTSGNGIMVIPAGEKTLRHIEGNSTNFNLNTANINDIFVDKDANLWLSCNKKGLYRLSHDSSAFTATTFTNQHYYLGSSISSIAAGSKGNVYATAQLSGVYIFNGLGQVEGSTATAVGPNYVYKDRTGDYWLCGENTLYAYNPSTGGAKPVAHYAGWGLNCMTDNGHGTYYICNYGNGLAIYDKGTGHTENISMRDTTRQGGTIVNDWIKALYLDHKARLWIATVDGISCMDTKSKSFKVIRNGTLLKGIPCFAITETRQGQILIGTNTGLFTFDVYRQKLSRPAGTLSLRDNAVYSIVEDKRGDLWMSTAAGIWQYDRNRKRLIGHISGNGLVDKEYVVGAAIHWSDDRITFATNDGITSFYPDEVRTSRTAMDSVYLTGFYIDGRQVNCHASKFTVGHNDNSLRLEYSLLNYSNVDEIMFQYRINNADQWISLAEGTNAISLNRLKSGTYHLQVRAVSNGTVSKHTNQITIKVKGPWYTSTSAIVTYFLLILAAAFMILRLRERQRKEELDEAKMRFLINATHDIRSPLTLIIDPLKRLKKNEQNAENLSYIDTIERNAQKLLFLVNSILDQRRIDKNQMHLHCQPTDLPEFLSASSAMFRYNARQHGIALRIKHSDELPKAWIDRVNFDKVMQNLLSNAFKFTPDGGEISINMDCNGKIFVIEVIDSGCGFSENDTEKLFDRFYQGTTKNDSTHSGTGIGLNLCRTLVLMHGGQIKAYNRTDGTTGAVLHIELPTGNAHLKPEEIMAEKQEVNNETVPKRSAGNNGHIMVVDDDAELANYIRKELAYWYRVDVLNNGLEAWEMLLRGSYDLVISDVMMPGMDGISLLKNIKGNSLVSDIPVILLTSKADVSDRLEGFRKGADAYIAKPFDMNELQVVVANLLANVRRLKGKFSGAQEQEGRVEPIKIRGNNDTLMDRIMKSLNDNMSDPNFNVEKLAFDVGISRAQLHRKMKEITGISTGEFIRNLKLEQAARLILKGDLNVTQVAYSVGFSNSTHFSTVFKKHFGVSPSEYSESQAQRAKNNEKETTQEPYPANETDSMETETNAANQIGTEQP